MKPGVDYVGISTPFYCNDGDGKFLLHRRGEACRDEQGAWDPGSGELEHGLSLEENVLKELKEEYLCTGEIQGRLPTHDIFRDQNGIRTHWIVVPFFIKVDPNDVRIGEPTKIAEIGWFTINDLPEPLHTGFQYTFKTFREEFEKYSS